MNQSETTAKTVLRVGVAQVFCHRTLKENLDQTLKMMGEICHVGCDVAVFPENHLQDLDGQATAEDFDHAVMAVRDCAKACHMNVVVGVAAQVIHKNHNRALVVDRAGEVVLFYQKNNEVPQRIWLDGVPCSVAICSDRWYLEHADLACLTQGSQVMIDISGGHGGDDGRPDLRWVRYRCWAIRNSVFVVVCNTPHHDVPDYMGHAIWGGHSAILNPSGNFLAQAHYENETIITADLSVDLATREHAERRCNHPLFKSWWHMGKVVLEGDDVDAPSFAPLGSRETELKIAVAQMGCSADLSESVMAMGKALKTASDDGADVVVFPERVVDGVDGNLLGQAFVDIRDHVRQNRVYAIWGMPFIENGCRFNSAVVMGRDGNLLTRYDQISAQEPFVAGRSTKAMWFEIEGVHATVTIGGDLYWPELTELAAYRGMQLHFHLDCWKGCSDDANLVRKQSAITYLAPAVFGVWANGAGARASGGSLLVGRKGGHGQPKPEGVEAYLPYYTSVLKTGGSESEVLYCSVKTEEKNNWQASRNKTRRNGRGHENWWKWMEKGVEMICAGDGIQTR